MYPDHATFQRMVEGEPNLSAAGRQTLLALFEGPLRLHQILDIINRTGDGTADKTITESALRKRLEILISRGILARAGSERTNPYYYIRRPWIFNQYILIRCKDQPGKGLLDLTVLLHELSQMVAVGEASHPHPRYITAVGERTERSHQIGAAYGAFQKMLGNKTAIGDYLEGIYEDIYEDRVPASDIDGLVARDFLRFVATAPDEEREVRLFLWYADFFHTLDRYAEAHEALHRGLALAKEQGLDLSSILSEFRISEGHILLHLNDIGAAKDAFLESGRMRGISPFAKARNLFGVGEAELVLGDIAPMSAPARFRQAEDLLRLADPEGKDPDVQELLADVIRRTGSIHRIQGRLDEAEGCYALAARIYQDGMPRGLVLLLPEQAELLRARAFRAPPGSAETLLAEADRRFDEAKAVSQRVRNINGYANCLIGECEVARTAYEKCGRALPHNLDMNFANAFEIYCQISSRWGIVRTFIAEALLYQSAADVMPDKYGITADKLEQAERFSTELGLMTELAVIGRIKTGRRTEPELNPMVFL